MVYPNSSDPGTSVMFGAYTSDHVVFTIDMVGRPPGIVRVDGIVKEDSIYYVEYHVCEIAILVETVPSYRATILNRTGNVIDQVPLEPDKWLYFLANPSNGVLKIYSVEAGELKLISEVSIPWTYIKDYSGPSYMGVSADMVGSQKEADWAAYIDFVAFGS